VSELDKKPKFGHEMRLLAASLLSMAVILLWTRFFSPKPPIVPQRNRPVQTGPATPGSPTTSSTSPTNTPAPLPKGTATGMSGAAAAAVKVTPKNDTDERTLVVENDLYRVELSNRGAVVKSWQLKKYLDDSKPPRVLDVVHAEAAQQTGGWPFALVMDDEQLQAAANGGLYQISSPAATLHAPADA